MRWSHIPFSLHFETKHGRDPKATNKGVLPCHESDFSLQDHLTSHAILNGNSDFRHWCRSVLVLGF